MISLRLKRKCVRLNQCEVSPRAVSQHRTNKRTTAIRGCSAKWPDKIDFQSNRQYADNKEGFAM